MALDDINRQTWVAVATKIGGQLVLVGGEFTEGTLVNCSNSHWRFDFNINSFRAGPGLGVGAGYCVVFAFNCLHPSQLDQTSIEDWGLNVSVAGKWTQIVNGLRNFNFYATIAKIGTKMAIGIEEAEKIKLSINYLWNALDISQRGGTPMICAIDTPLGIGAELSLVKIYGKFILGENKSVPTPRR